MRCVIGMDRLALTLNVSRRVAACIGHALFRYAARKKS
jgi:hypothetical protein|eukprot:COSAG01_NODE_928_length_12680_cov_73.441380_18_plen_38_part_00